MLAVGCVNHPSEWSSPTLVFTSANRARTATGRVGSQQRCGYRPERNRPAPQSDRDAAGSAGRQSGSPTFQSDKRMDPRGSERIDAPRSRSFGPNLAPSAVALTSGVAADKSDAAMATYSRSAGEENGFVASTTNMTSALRSVAPVLETSIGVPASCPGMA